MCPAVRQHKMQISPPTRTECLPRVLRTASHAKRPRPRRVHAPASLANTTFGLCRWSDCLPWAKTKPAFTHRISNENESHLAHEIAPTESANNSPQVIIMSSMVEICRACIWIVSVCPHFYQEESLPSVVRFPFLNSGAMAVAMLTRNKQVKQKYSSKCIPILASLRKP